MTTFFGCLKILRMAVLGLEGGRRGWGHGCVGEDEDKDKNDENKPKSGDFSVEGGCRYIAAELLVGAAASFTYLIKGTQQVLELEALSE